MERIWAPWRMTYIQGNTVEPGCLFCSRLTQHDGPDNLILHRTKVAYIILNRYPYTNGHLMIVPNAHKSTIEELKLETLTDLMHLARSSLELLRHVYNAQSFNIGINIGEAAGAGVTDHVHLHIVPRWLGDTSFMTTTADTRVLPEAIEETYERLSEGWQALHPNS